MTRGNGNLVALLEEEVLPRLFERLDTAFPEFGWEPTQEGWVATSREATKRLLDARPERVICNRPFGYYAHGGESRSWLAHVNGGQAPRGEAFVAAVTRLCELAGVPAPGDKISAKDQRALHRAEARREALEAVTKITQQAYRGPLGATARAYVAGRGLDDATSKGLGLGYYTSPVEVRRALAPEVHPAAQEAVLLRDQLSGYLRREAAKARARARSSPRTAHTAAWPAWGLTWAARLCLLRPVGGSTPPSRPGLSSRSRAASSARPSGSRLRASGRRNPFGASSTCSAQAWRASAPRAPERHALGVRAPRGRPRGHAPRRGASGRATPGAAALA